MNALARLCELCGRPGALEHRSSCGCAVCNDCHTGRFYDVIYDDSKGVQRRFGAASREKAGKLLAACLLWPSARSPRVIDRRIVFEANNLRVRIERGDPFPIRGGLFEQHPDEWAREVMRLWSKAGFPTLVGGNAAEQAALAQRILSHAK